VYTDVANAVALCQLHLAHGDMLPFRVLRAIRTWLQRLAAPFIVPFSNVSYHKYNTYITAELY